ncbi:type II toxin-antitoxin system RelE/ParE family toxin [Zymobacter sp. IVIA_12111.31 C1]|uniref:type II toxin-antitoxin system RelE/ParE family toxin n=1 Tax=Zymobacter sp. IVIA_12111.31 C1 TaxID=3394854 RepID=UPI0039C20E5C
MKEIIQTSVFKRWFTRLRDRRARARISLRLDRLQADNAGDVKPVGDGISEMRIDYGPGYRVYYQQKGPIVILLLCGGDKSTQSSDIAKAKEIAKAWREKQ